MKKWISLLLAAMMVLGLADAVAAKLTVNGNQDILDGKLMTDKDSIATDLYLQVSNDAQIDVTVPLILVFSTNLDGGSATEPVSGYVITNNNPDSTLYVHSSQVTARSLGVMTPKLLTENLDTVNSYHAKLDFGQVNIAPTGASEVWKDRIHDLGSDQTYNFAVATDDGNKSFYPSIKPNGALSIKPHMETSPLNFITGSEKGLHLLTITYTVGTNPNVETKGTADIPMDDRTNGNFLNQ